MRLRGRLALGLAVLLAGSAALKTASAVATGELGAAGAGDAASSTSEGLHWLMDRLRQKERSLDHREATIAAREADLRLAEKKLEQRMVELQGLRTEIAAQLKGLDSAQEERVMALVHMFEGMRAKDAAAIVSAEDPKVTLEVLERMSRMKAGKILAEMDPAMAASLADRFAAGKALPSLVTKP